MASVKIRKSSCGICSSQCPLDIRVQDGKIRSVEGGKNNPFQYGGICSKGAASRQYVYNKERILYPMKRVGKKGEGKFERISWEEAFHIIKDRLNELREKYGPESVVFYAGYPKWFRPALLRFANAFGSPNYCTESSTCFQAANLAWRSIYGNNICPPDLRHTKTLLNWSKNLYHSAVDMAEAYRELKDRGVTVIAVDTRNSVTAHDASLRLQPYPGTDGALALAMANVIISEKLYDREFVQKYVYGFEEYAEYVKKFSPKEAEQITGVPGEQIVQAARIFACNKPSSILFSASSIVHHINGVQNQRAVFSLLAITGNYDVDGGNVCMPGETAPRNEYGKVTRFHEIPAIGEKDYPVWFDLPCEEANCARLSEYIAGDGPYPIKGIFALGLNHRMWPQPEKLNKELETLDFYVNSDLFLSDSSKAADLVLPACSSLEREELVFRGGAWVELTQKAIEPLGESRNDIEMIIDLMKYMGLKDQVLSGTYEEYLDYILQPSGLTVKELRKHPGGMKAANVLLPERRSWEREPIHTPSGKIELKSLVMEKYRESHGIRGLPVYCEYRDAQPYRSGEYPLILNTGSRRPQWFHARMYRLPWLARLEKAPLVQIHPSDGAGYGIREGQRVRVVSPAGSITGYAEYNIAQKQGVVHIYHGLKGADANELIPESWKDPVSGFPGYKSYFCRIEPGDSGSGTNTSESEQ